MTSPRQPAPAHPTVSDAELDVLKTLWEHGPATVREAHERLTEAGKDWAYNTVLTLLTRLRDKKIVRSRQRGAALVFSAVVNRQRLLSRRLNELVDRVCDGSAAPLVHALVKTRNLTAQDIDQLRDLLDRIDHAGGQ